MVAVIYIAMTTVMLELIPWQEAEASRTLASIFIARTVEDPGLAQLAGSVITALILFVAVASVFAFALGYSRMPYAAARDGQFFRIFGKVHPTRGFPHVSLIWLIAVSIPFCFFSLGQLVNWLMQVQILLRFTWQCVAVLLIARYRPDIPQPFGCGSTRSRRCCRSSSGSPSSSPGRPPESGSRSDSCSWASRPTGSSAGGRATALPRAEPGTRAALLAPAPVCRSDRTPPALLRSSGG